MGIKWGGVGIKRKKWSGYKMGGVGIKKAMEWVWEWGKKKNTLRNNEIFQIVEF